MLAVQCVVNIGNTPSDLAPKPLQCVQRWAEI